jgi:predicted nucleic acid-binding protein
MQLPRGSHFISALVELEAVNALELRVFRKEISSSQAQSSLKHFEKDILGGILQLRPLSDQAFERACRLAKQTAARLGTRTADLLHVAAALELGVDYLYSFDQQQRKLAEVVRLKLN